MATRDTEAAEGETDGPRAGDAAEAVRARNAGIDAAVLDRLLSPMEPDERTTIRELCARDLEITRRGARGALRDWDSKALARHLHVMTSLAQTVGAEALAETAGRMQTRMRSGATEGYDETARRMDELAQRAAKYLGGSSA